MTLAKNFKSYKNEIELIKAQNPVECELYSIIASIMRERKNSNNISVRDVSVRRTTDFSESFKSESGFPDFVILTKKFRMDKPNNEDILGAIEAKSILDKTLEDSEQLKGHLKKFKKVIYTNGLEWKFYEYGRLDEVIILGKWSKDEIYWESNDEWNHLLDKLDKIVWIEENDINTNS